jgi:hypothetical protein
MFAPEATSGAQERGTRAGAGAGAGVSAAAGAGPLTITAMRAWRIKEPVGGRRYTVVRLETRGGIAGYGEGGPLKGIEIDEATLRILGRRAVEYEYFRHTFAASPAIEAAVSNACLDILARHGKAPLYSGSSSGRCSRSYLRCFSATPKNHGSFFNTSPSFLISSP